MEIIWDLYHGDSHFYTVIEKEKFRRFVKEANRLIETMPKTTDEWLSKIDSLQVKDDVTNWTLIGNKTVTNINSGMERVTLDVHKRICKGVLDELMNISNEELKADLTMIINEREVLPELTSLFLAILSSLHEKISGSLRSEYGKAMDIFYLRYLFDALSINDAGDSIHFVESNKLYYSLNKRWECLNGVLRKVSGDDGREVDGMVFTIDENQKIIPLIAIEFTVGGRGNPSAAVNKAKSIVSFKPCLNDGLVFFAFDVGDLRRDIDPAVTQIYFKEQIETKPLETIYHLLQKRLIDVQQIGIDLPPLDVCKSKFRHTISENCR